MLSTAAGILVTRVASEEPDRSLGSELAGQLLGIPKAMRVAGILVLGLGAVPGLPGVPFFLLGALLLASARARSRSARRGESVVSGSWPRWSARSEACRCDRGASRHWQTTC